MKKLLEHVQGWNAKRRKAFITGRPHYLASSECTSCQSTRRVTRTDECFDCTEAYEQPAMTLLDRLRSAGVDARMSPRSYNGHAQVLVHIN
jgi:hypothetical protein